MPADMPGRTAAAAKTVYRFAEFEVRPDSGELFRNGHRVRVQQQSLEVLLALLENSGSVVTREQLRERLWPEGTYVDFEHSLNAAVKRLRAALEDDADNPHYIETLPKRGYRLVTDATVQPSSDEAKNGERPPILLPPSHEAQPKPSVELSKKSRRNFVQRDIIVAALLILITATAVFFLLRRHEKTLIREKFSTGSLDVPQNAEAYELYLRSLGYRYEFPENRQAIALLERSTTFDSHSARSWYELARRYTIEFTNAAGGRGFLEQASEANRRALELAPDFSPARLQRIMLDVLGGRLIPAYHAALAMAREHPQDGNAHFALAYTLRHGGMFEEAAVECDRALALDPSNAAFRPCTLINILLGRYNRASVFLDLDPLSVNSRFRRMELAILRNDRAAALQEVRTIRISPRSYADARLMEAALSGASAETIRNWSQEDEALNDRISLPELHFVDARYQSWAGQPEAALRLLRRAIANNYCSYPAMDFDPFLVNIRKLPEYKELRQAGITCRENFRAQMLPR